MLLISATPAAAAPGDLDPTFSRDGKVTSDLGAYDVAHDMAIQRNGRIVVVGSSRQSSSGPAALAIAQYTRNGKPDQRFAGDGNLIAPIGESVEAYAVAIQPDGRIVVAASIGHGPAAGFLLRFRPDGDLDGSFSDDGIIAVPGFTYTSVALQPDGKIVVTGDRIHASNASDIALARYRPDGSPDHAFASEGLALIDTVYGRGNQLQVQRDGKVVVSGSVGSGIPGSGSGGIVARYQTSGALDPSFAGGIRDFDRLPPGLVKPIHDGTLLFAYGHPEDGPFNLRHFKRNGTKDHAFGLSGLSRIGFPGYADLAALDLQSKKRSVLAGWTFDEGLGDFALARFRLDAGPNDLDADSVVDDRDACPRLFGKKNSGCPRG